MTLCQEEIGLGHRLGVVPAQEEVLVEGELLAVAGWGAIAPEPDLADIAFALNVAKR